MLLILIIKAVFYTRIVIFLLICYNYCFIHVCLCLCCTEEQLQLCVPQVSCTFIDPEAPPLHSLGLEYEWSLSDDESSKDWDADDDDDDDHKHRSSGSESSLSYVSSYCQIVMSADQSDVLFREGNAYKRCVWLVNCSPVKQLVSHHVNRAVWECLRVIQQVCRRHT